MTAIFDKTYSDVPREILDLFKGREHRIVRAFLASFKDVTFRFELVPQEKGDEGRHIRASFRGFYLGEERNIAFILNVPYDLCRTGEKCVPTIDGKDVSFQALAYEFIREMPYRQILTSTVKLEEAHHLDDILEHFNRIRMLYYKVFSFFYEYGQLQKNKPLLSKLVHSGDHIFIDMLIAFRTQIYVDLHKFFDDNKNTTSFPALRRKIKNFMKKTPFKKEFDQRVWNRHAYNKTLKMFRNKIFAHDQFKYQGKEKEAFERAHGILATYEDERRFLEEQIEDVYEKVNYLSEYFYDETLSREKVLRRATAGLSLFRIVEQYFDRKELEEKISTYD